MIFPELGALRKAPRRLDDAAYAAWALRLAPVLSQLLVAAVERDDAAGVQELVGTGMNLGSVDPQGKTAIGAAIANGRDNLALSLLQQGARPTLAFVNAAAASANASIFVGLMDAIGRESSEARSAILQAADADLLFAFAASPSPDAMATVLGALGENAQRFVQATDEQGNTPMSLAEFWKNDAAASQLRAKTAISSNAA